MKRGQVRIAAQDYATNDEVYEHARYILHISRELLLEYALAYHPRAYWATKWALNSYTRDPDSLLWRPLAASALLLAKRVSENVNMKGHNPQVFIKRPRKELITMELSPKVSPHCYSINTDFINNNNCPIDNPS